MNIKHNLKPLLFEVIREELNSEEWGFVNNEVNVNGEDKRTILFQMVFKRLRNEQALSKIQKLIRNRDAQEIEIAMFQQHQYEVNLEMQMLEAFHARGVEYLDLKVMNFTGNVNTSSEQLAEHIFNCIDDLELFKGENI